MMMELLTEEQQECYLQSRAKNRMVKESMDILYLSYPDAHRYAKNWFIKFHQKAGKARIDELKKKYQAEAMNESYGIKENRVMLYIEVLDKMACALRSMNPAKDERFTVLSREVREYLKAVKEEVDEAILENTDVRSAFENLMQNLKGVPELEQVVGQMVSMPQTPGN